MDIVIESEPQYEHDCDECVSLGRSTTSTYFAGNLSVDLYVHIRESKWHDLVVRFGNRGEEYWCLAVKEPEGFQTIPMNQMFQEVWERAIRAGVISTEE